MAKSDPTTALVVYSSLTQTAEAIEALSGAVNTQLKQGLNERVSQRQTYHNFGILVVFWEN